jgi:beta-lactamase regulating signal transducer with metallopeptidase domain
MNSFIEILNQWGENFLSFAWPMLWQSSLFIVVLFAFDFLFRRKVRACVRYALWLVLLVKLLLPPTLALPTGLAWWLHFSSAKTQTSTIVTYGAQTIPTFTHQTPPSFNPIQPTISFAAWTLITVCVISTSLFVWLLIRWMQVARKVQRTTRSEKLIPILDEARSLAGLRSKIKVRLTEGSMSPAVCELIRPVILLPQSLVEKLSADQLRAVLLHELIHLRRGDVWVNCLQTLLQIFYWWNPLLWFANARIRHVREEAVDDSVMLTLAGDSDSYASTLLEVAKFAFDRPLTSLGLIGILESRSALRLRIERLVDFKAPKKIGLSVLSLFGLMIFTAVAVPMGQAPLPTESQNLVGTKNANASPQFHIKARFIEVPTDNFVDSAMLTNNVVAGMTGILTSENLKKIMRSLEAKPGVETFAEPEVVTTSGRQTQMRATEVITVVTNFAYQKTATNGSIIAPQTDQVETGPVLDVVPVVLSDGYTINLTTIASMTEFLGYDEPPTEHIPKGDTSVHLPVILPSFYVQQASANLNLQDNQTIVLGKLQKHLYVDGKEVSAEPDYFVKTKKSRGQPDVEDKELLVFITVTLVDRAGNRIHPKN